MFVLSYFVHALANVLDLMLKVYFWVVIAAAVLTWVNPDPAQPLVRFLRQVTEPVFGAVRRRLPTVAGGLDLSPMVVLLAILFLQWFLVGSLLYLATSLR